YGRGNRSTAGYETAPAAAPERGEITMHGSGAEYLGGTSVVVEVGDDGVDFIFAVGVFVELVAHQVGRQVGAEAVRPGDRPTRRDGKVGDESTVTIVVTPQRCPESGAVGHDLLGVPFRHERVQSDAGIQRVHVIRGVETEAGIEGHVVVVA